MSSIQTITVEERSSISNDLPDASNYMKIESHTEASTKADVAAPLPASLLVVTYVTIAIMVLLVIFNAVLLYYRLKEKRRNECDNCDLPQETREDPKEIYENETAEESSSDEDTEDNSETSSSGKEYDTVSEDSVKITFEIENFSARNTVVEGLNKSNSETVEKCDECEKVFESKSTLMSHIVEDHTSLSTEQSEKVSNNINNTTSASTVILSNESAVSSSLLLETVRQETNDVSIDMFQMFSSLPSNVTSASTVILTTSDASNMVSNNVNIEAQSEPIDASKDMFESSVTVLNEASKVNVTENTSIDTSRGDLKRKSRRRSGKHKNKHLLDIACQHCDARFVSEYSLGQHKVMKHNS